MGPRERTQRIKYLGALESDPPTDSTIERDVKSLLGDSESFNFPKQTPVCLSIYVSTLIWSQITDILRKVKYPYVT